MNVAKNERRNTLFRALGIRVKKFPSKIVARVTKTTSDQSVVERAAASILGTEYGKCSGLKRKCRGWRT